MTSFVPREEFNRRMTSFKAVTVHPVNVTVCAIAEGASTDFVRREARIAEYLAKGMQTVKQVGT
jgi:hypothetical protein